MKINYTYIFFILFFFGNITISPAQLIIQDSRIKREIEPASTVLDTLLIQNSSTAQLKVKVYWQDFDYQSPYYEGVKEFSPVGTSDYSCHDYVSFSPKEMTLPAYGKDEVKYSINVPENFQGGCNGVMFFEIGGTSPDSKVGVSIVTRIGALFFLESTNKTKSAQITDIAIKEDILQGKVVNRGNVVLFPKGVYYVLNKDGFVEDRGQVNPIYLPPSKKADFQFALPDKLKIGKYTLVLTFDLEGGDNAVKEVDLSKKNNNEVVIVETRN
jgi:hypothetical protein